jgi:hypothetical protein
MTQYRDVQTVAFNFDGFPSPIAEWVSDVRRLSRQRKAQQGIKVPKREIRSLPTWSYGVIRYCDFVIKRNQTKGALAQEGAAARCPLSWD